jgi:hypothetical protein
MYFLWKFSLFRGVLINISFGFKNLLISKIIEIN